jgi:hypothetical protein
LPFTWVRQSLRSHSLLEPPADSFFDAVIEIGDLDEEQAADLLRRQAQHAGSGDPGAEILLSLAAALAQRVKPLTPRNLLAAARDVRVPPSSPNAVPRLTVRTLDSSRPHRTGVVQSVRFPRP